MAAAVVACRPGTAGAGAGAAAPAADTRTQADTVAFRAGAEEVPAIPPGPSPSSPSMPRWRATGDVVSATVMRVRGAAQATPGPRLANYLVNAGTERPLSKEQVRELVALVRSPTAFDDSIVKRCRPGTSVGFRLSRNPSGNAQAAATEMVLDFACAKLTVLEVGLPSGVRAGVHASYFDPDRSKFLAFVRDALPRDPEIVGLR